MTTEPKPGQVLKWCGGSRYPADDNVGTNSPSASTPAIQTFFKAAPFSGQGSYNIDDSKPETEITVLTHTIVITKSTRFVISANVNLYGVFCPVGCSNGEGSILINFG